MDKITHYGYGRHMAAEIRINLWWLDAWRHQAESNFTASAQATILYAEFQNYIFKITTTAPMGQCVNIRSSSGANIGNINTNIATQICNDIVMIGVSNVPGDHVYHLTNTKKGFQSYRVPWTVSYDFFFLKNGEFLWQWEVYQTAIIERTEINSKSILALCSDNHTYMLYAIDTRTVY